MELDISEALRALGAGDRAPEALRRETAAVARRLTETLRPRYAYRVFSLRHENGGVLLREAALLLPGEDIKALLAQCDRAALLACTLGVEFDALLRGEQVRDMARAVILDACGSAWVEAGCDAAEVELAVRFPDLFLTDRFSPGYGDLPLSLQRDICGALDARRLGIHVTEQFLLNPAKTVTAVIGLSDRPQPARVRGCDHCTLRETCSLRKGGKHCAK